MDASRLCLAPQSAQEVFDFAAKHLLNQNRKSIDKTGYGCTYRGVNGAMCPVGIFLSDEEVNNLGNGMKVTEMLRRNVAPQRLVPYGELLIDLQALHDHHNITDWRAGLRRIANRYGFQFNL